MSPLTYQVVGHLKTVCILASGYVLFAQPVAFINIIGASIALCSLWVYSAVKSRDAEPKMLELKEPEEETAAPPKM